MAKQTKAEKIRQKRWTEIRNRFERGEPYSAIAKDIGVSPATMLKWLMQEGYKYRTKGRYPLAMRPRVKEMVARGWEIEDVASILKIEKKLATRWYTEALPKAKAKPAKPEKGAKKNPAPKRHQLSPQAQRLIGDPRVPRHKRGKRWEVNQMRFVVDLIKKRFSVIEVYRIMGASKVRQSKIWKELVGRRRTPPNFPSEEGPARPRHVLGETARQKQRRTRGELAAARRKDGRERGLARRKDLAAQRRAAAVEGTREVQTISATPADLPPPEPGTPVVTPLPGEPSVFVEPRELPPSRESELPRPPWERKKKPKKKKPKKKRRRR